MAETKKEFRYFTVTDYKAEEDYLRQKHREGWRFTDVNLPGIFTFERCESEDVIYRTDLRPLKDENKEAARGVFRAQGWEHVLDFGEYSFFRKPAADVEPDDGDVFTAPASRLEAIRRMLYRRVLPVLLILALFLPAHVNYIRDNGPGGPAVIALTVLWYGILLAYAVLTARAWVAYYRMWKQYLSSNR